MSAIDQGQPQSEHHLLQDHKQKGWSALFAFTRKPHLLVLLPAILLSLAAGLILPVTAIFFGRVFNNFSDYAAGKIEATIFTRELTGNIYALLVLGAATFVLKGGLFNFWLQFGEMQARCVREELFRTLLEKDLEWYDLRTRGVETLLTRTQTQIRDLRVATSQPLGFSISYLAQALAALALALFTNWKVSLAIFASVPVTAMGIALISRRIQENTERHNHNLTQAVRLATYAITNIVIVKCFNTQRQEEENYAKAVKNAALNSLKLGFSNALQSGFSRFISIAMFVQGFWYGGSQVHAGRTTTGKVITTFWSCIIAAKSFESILPQGIILQKGRAAAVALEAVLGKVLKGKPDSVNGNGIAPHFCEGNFEFRSVSFAYPSNPNHLVLRDCTFSFPAGQTTYLVGKSGCGKSTLSSMLLRFYPINSGTISLDGVEIQTLDKSWLKNNITLVQQQCHLFNETIYMNIALGRVDPNQVTEDEIRHCLHMAALETTVANLPQGANTRVGVGGSSLSGGQKQRIAIARAYLRDTPVLILDEATSALDYTTRTTVMETIRKWRRGKTTIIITHDLERIGADDFVYVLDAGVVLRQGRRKDVAGLVKRLTVIGDSNHSDNSPSHQQEAIVYPFSRPRHATKTPTSTHNSSDRKDSFDAELERVAQPSVSRARIDPPSSGARQTFKNSVSLGLQGTLMNLRRQSMARAKALYTPVPPTPGLPSTEKRVGSLKWEMMPSHHRKSSFLRARDDAPDSNNKPLPIPLIAFSDPSQSEILGVSEVNREEQLSSPSSLLTILRTVLPDAYTKKKIKIAVAIIATIGHASMAPVFSWVLAQVLTTFYLASGFKQKLLIYSLSMLGVAIVDGLCCFTMVYLLDSVAQSWVDMIRSQAMHRILRQPKGWFDEDLHNTPFILSALDSNAEEMKDIVGKYAAQIVTLTIIMLVATIWSFVTCWKITLVSLAGTPVVYGLAKVLDMVSAHWENLTNMRSERIGAIFVETFVDIRTVRALTLESYFHKKYSIATQDAFSAGRRRALFTGIFYGLSESSINFLCALVFWYGGHLAKRQEWPVSSILTVFSLILFCAANATAIMAYIPQINSATDTATRLLDLAKMSVHSHEDLGTFLLDVADRSTLSGPIHFINQTFHYPTRPDTAALLRLNLTIPSGKCTAIVGESGSGKSTITSLILGLYPATADAMARSPTDSSWDPPSLTLSGRDIKTLDLPTLRSMIGIVPQTPVLLPGTVRENIIYGLQPDSATISATKIEAAAQMAGIHEFIQSLPQGYATVVGEGGMGMSGGQAQRIVIARALIRKPRILILDEATSALDDESARIIKNSVIRLIRETQGCLTVIIVTHSKAMMSFADQVIVMDGGCVAEQGSYTELLARGGKLWERLKPGTSTG